MQTRDRQLLTPQCLLLQPVFQPKPKKILFFNQNQKNYSFQPKPNQLCLFAANALFVDYKAVTTVDDFHRWFTPRSRSQNSALFTPIHRGEMTKIFCPDLTQKSAHCSKTFVTDDCSPRAIFPGNSKLNQAHTDSQRYVLKLR